MKSAEQRKLESNRLLQQQGIPYLDQYPVIDNADNVRLRSEEEISRRALCCLITIQLACDMQNSTKIDESVLYMTGLLDRFGVRPYLTEKEKRIFDKTATDQDLIDMIWKYESYWTLIWALGLIDELKYPSEICDCHKAIEVVSRCATFNEFVSRTHLRSIEEILDATDLYCRYSWACQDALENGKECPAHLNHEIVFERTWGLNWLIDADYRNNWDKVKEPKI